MTCYGINRQKNFVFIIFLKHHLIHLHPFSDMVHGFNVIELEKFNRGKKANCKPKSVQCDE